MPAHSRDRRAQWLWISGLLAAIYCPAAGVVAQAAEGDSFEISVCQRPVCIEVAGFSPEQLAFLREAEWDAARWQKLLRVSVMSEADDLPAVLGRWRVTAQTLQFVPRFPLEAGIDYRVVLNPQMASKAPTSEAAIGKALIQVIRLQDTPKPARTTVTAVYPSADVLPENLLRFYLHFSGSMSRGEAYDRVHLFDDAGDEVEYPFLTLDQELWDPHMRRFTLLFDPGRVKRGLKPREEFGPALETGRSYRLVIDAAWMDAHGQALAAPFTKEFRVVDPDDVQPKVENWKLYAPRAGSRKPLVVDFEEPLDQGLLQHMLAVQAPSGEVVAGAVAVEQAETRWRFVPDHPWQSGPLAVVVNASLEDRAGNSLRRLFEVDVFEKVTRELQRDFVRVPFVVE